MMPRTLHVLYAAAFLAATAYAATPSDSPRLRSISPSEVLEKLDLNHPGLDKAREAVVAGKQDEAFAALLQYYRAKYPAPASRPGASAPELKRADDVTAHVFQWGPYEPVDYGTDIDWAADPRGDIEWVAAMYRFYWANDLVQAYGATGEEKYARAFVDLTTDWVRKHPLENRNVVHPVYTHWKGYPWLDIQTGIRATNLCRAFPVMVQAKAFTPEFLGVLLASLYDHQQKTEFYPMGVVHNKAIFEQKGFVNVASTFPEFKDSRRWLELALGRARENLLAQTTFDGVQREWSGGYHLGVLRDAVEIMQRMDSAGIAVPDDYRNRVRAMYEYVFAMATPDLGFAMFGDTSRPYPAPARREDMQLYGALVQATSVTGDPKFAARARLQTEALPETKSYAFPEAGMYFMRNAWGPDQIYFALHCSPPAISGHDQPDNGTFELCAFGQWLMNDTGFYTYGHDPAARAWHRQTRVHDSMTLDGRDAAVAGRCRLWKSGPGLDALCVENASYPDLAHRRTVWFVDRRFFVILDEAVGNAKGNVDLHFQFAPGEVTVDPARHRATTAREGANVLLWMDPAAPVTLESEEGWFAWEYGHRTPRVAVRFRAQGQAPATFLTVIVPYRDAAAPEVQAGTNQPIQARQGRVELQVNVSGVPWNVGRDLGAGEAWAVKAESGSAAQKQ